MRKMTVLLISLLFLGLTAVFPQDFSGTYILNQGGATLTLIIQQDTQGNLTGTLSSTSGALFKLSGQLDEQAAVGVVISEEGGLYFEGEIQGTQLVFTLIEPDSNNMPNYNSAQQLLFTKQAAQTPSTSSSKSYSGPMLPPKSSQSNPIIIPAPS